MFLDANFPESFTKLIRVQSICSVAGELEVVFMKTEI